MRRVNTILTASFLAIAFTAGFLRAQQPPSSSGSVPPVSTYNPMTAGRTARSLLRNGQDYLSYKKYDRALKFFNEALKHQDELDPDETRALKQAIVTAQRGMRETADADEAAPTNVGRAAPARGKTIAARRRAGGFTPASPDLVADDPGAPIADDAERSTIADDSPLRSPLPPLERPRSVADAAAGGAKASSAPSSARIEVAASPREIAPPIEPAPAPAAIGVPGEASADNEVRVASTEPRMSPEPDDLPPAVAEKAAPAPAAVPPAAASPVPKPKPAGAQSARLPQRSALPETVEDADLPPLVIEEKEQTTTETPVQPAAPVADPVPANDPPNTSALPQAKADEELPPTVAPAASPTAAIRTAADDADRVRRDPSATELGQDLPPLPDSAPPARRSESRADEPELGKPSTDALPPLPDTPEAPQPKITAGEETTSAPPPPAIDPGLPPLPAEAPPRTSGLPTRNIPETAPDHGPAMRSVPTATDPYNDERMSRDPSLGLKRTLSPGLRSSDSKLQLDPEIEREIENLARRQTESQPARDSVLQSPPPDPFDDSGAQMPGIVLPRAPSPTEARAIRPIPMPEEFVPLGPRQWAPTRKAWAAAATCHLPLYFQDATLERYGHNAEQFFGPAGRYFTYPLDDPTQSNQSMQLLQPFKSFGLFCSQIVLWPYNAIMDPPWEAEYDLGYWRPGDRVPTDVIYTPTHGVGPALRGADY